MEEKVQLGDLFAVKEARMRADLAVKEVECAQLRLFNRYGLKEGDQVNMDTGVIVRAPKPSPESPAA